MKPLVRKTDKTPDAPPVLKPVPSLGKNPLPLWTSTGVREKPEGCALCPFQTKGSGFVPDWYPDAHGEAPRIGFLLDHPTSDEVLEQRPWAGRAGYAWEKKYLKPFGLSLSDVFIGHVIRCQPRERKWGKPVYPTATLKRGAELTCRQHDKVCWGGDKLRKGGLHALNPDLFVVTFHPNDALLVPAFSRLIEADIKKAVGKMQEGRRPLVLMGNEARELVAPWTANKGGTKTWRGTFWAGEWPFKQGSSLIEPGFVEI